MKRFFYQEQRESDTAIVRDRDHASRNFASCERADAEFICAALNAADERQKASTL